MKIEKKIGLIFREWICTNGSDRENRVGSAMIWRAGFDWLLAESRLPIESLNKLVIADKMHVMDND